MIMQNEFDDELTRMDELENASDMTLNKALSLDDTISSLELRDHPTVQTGTSLQSVIDILRKKKVGCVMVESGGKIVGVMTERDFLLRAISKGLDTEKEIIDDYMTSNPETLQANDPIAFALNKMHVFGIRHIPIINQDNSIHGMVSVKDVIAHIGNYFADQIVNLPPQPDRKALDRPEGG
ncbi:MAG: CBS domain-containing protein [Candidatus Marinimicrobia bacterium]|jgi:CBS domain-containing protein|nr:CBS domain-containing protein [Candidatus Neomarinimicrobiota bacterium]MBT4271453.1 CBS domain-containing protein [Candidatus Neomarinimicrobiota bacterium]MBT4809228.1 CBS domain-containing protein [Candidatus Neomarinimicrobiota bacterium]MBT7496048.1 CBS domain-containing protein [Candidatus Neomarinimicrobiota bacterium]